MLSSPQIGVPSSSLVRSASEAAKPVPAFSEAFDSFCAEAHAKLSKQMEILLNSLDSYRLIIASSTLELLQGRAKEFLAVCDAKEVHDGHTLFLSKRLTDIQHRHSQVLELQIMLAEALMKGELK